MRRRRILSAILVLVTLAIGGYVWFLYDRLSDRPRITRDVLVEINAPIHKIPNAERAWPLYRTAIAQLEADSRSFGYEEVAPGNSKWPQFAAAVERHQEALAQIRNAAKRPHLGYIYSYTSDPEFNSSDDSQTAPDYGQGGVDSILLTAHDKLGLAVRFLAADARLAIGKRDGARATEDVIAIASISRHLREPPFYVSLLISWHKLSRAISVFGDALETDGSMFSQEQLDSIVRSLTKAADVDPKAAFSFELIAANDYEQRNFTDDGHGDGYFLGEREDTPLGSLLNDAGLPLDKRTIRRDMITRRRFREKMRELTDVTLHELENPLWEIETFTADSELARLGNNKQWQPLLFPIVAPIYYRGQLIRMRVDALRVAVAAEKCRRRHGTWPERLDQLVPDFLPSPPLDRHDGQPLRYRLVDGLPLVYATGLDRVDDSGKPLPADAHENLTRPWAVTDLSAAVATRGDVILWPESTIHEATKREAATQIVADLLELMTQEPDSGEGTSDE